MNFTQFLADILGGINSVFGNYGWSIMVFTLLIRLVLMPFDYKSRVSMRRMSDLQPQIAVLQKKYAKDQAKLNQKTSELYKKEHINPLSGCLPLLLSYPILIAMFGAMRYIANEQVVQQVLAIFQNPDALPKFESWLWVKNIFVSDNWAQSVPNYTSVTGQTGFATSRLSGVEKAEYEMVMGKVLGTGGYGKNGKWNGLLILPVLSILLSFLSTFLLNKAQGQPPQLQQKTADGQNPQMNTSKMMQWIMPLMMGVFSLLYSGAFALYMFTSSAVAIMFQLTFNLVAKIVDNTRGVRPNVAKK